MDAEKRKPHGTLQGSQQYPSRERRQKDGEKTITTLPRYEYSTGAYTASPAGRRAPSAPSGLIPFINATSKPLPSCLTLRIGTIPGWSRSKSSPAFPQSVQPRLPKRPQEPRLLRGVTTYPYSCSNCCSCFPTLAGRWRSKNNLEG